MAHHDSNFDANKRLIDATNALAFISDTLNAKGFLGQSLGEDRGLPSVGISAARRAGVIVDDKGKMRCPPGTPNANQFTDINMSNCMIPSAETVAGGALDLAKRGMPDSSMDKKRANTVEVFSKLNSDIRGSLSKRVGNLTDEEKSAIGRIAIQSAYWATFFGHFSSISEIINNVTTGLGDADSFDDVKMLTGLFVSGGLPAVKNTLELAGQKWNKSREQVKQYQDAFMSQMERLKVRGGELSSEAAEALKQTLASIKDKIMNISVEARVAKSYEQHFDGIPASSMTGIGPDILAVLGINLEDWRVENASKSMSTFKNGDSQKYSQRRLRTAANER